MDFLAYFQPQHQFYLDNISYETIKKERPPEAMKLNVKDTIVAQLIDGFGVRITFNRALNFEPENLFVLSVTYGVILTFNPALRDTVDWKNTDIASEFKRGGGTVLTNLSARTSLLVSQITSSAGQTPIITPVAAPNSGNIQNV